MFYLRYEYRVNKLSSKKDLWETPQKFFDELDREFNLHLILVTKEMLNAKVLYSKGRWFKTRLAR